MAGSPPRATSLTGMQALRRALVPVFIAAGVGVVAASVGVATAKSSGSASAASCASTAAKRVAVARKPMKLTPGPALDGQSLAGKNIWFISPDQSIPYVNQQTAAIQEAAKSLGIHLHVFDGKSNPTLFNQGFSTAISQNADGIMLNSMDPGLLSGPLAKARQAKIPVVDVLVGLPGQPETPGIFITLRTNTPAIGRAMADAALASTNCKTTALILTSSVYPFVRYLTNGAKAEFKALCPSCKVITDSVDPSKLATTVGPLVSNELRRNPGINYMLPTYTAMIPYMLPAMQQLNKKVPIISAAGVNPDFDQVRSGATAGDVSLPPAAYFGYLQFDAMLRAILGLPKPNGTLPTQLLDQTNIGKNDALGSLFPGVASYKSVYQKLWGAKG